MQYLCTYQCNFNCPYQIANTSERKVTYVISMYLDDVVTQIMLSLSKRRPTNRYEKGEAEAAT